VGHHKLILLPFYSFCVRYLQPHQQFVTQVLAALIQASHDLVPPEELEPIVRHLADQFVNDRTGPEVMAVGLNSIRELITRVPLITNGQGFEDLIADLIAYRKYRRDRSVIVAARALINALRFVVVVAPFIVLQAGLTMFWVAKPLVEKSTLLCFTDVSAASCTI